MVEISEIVELAQRIAARFHPERIILFGSYAEGNPTVDSDVDLLVVLPFQGKSWQAASEIRRFAQVPFPMDLLVRTPEQLRQRLIVGDSFLQQILQQGKILYEA